MFILNNVMLSQYVVFFLEKICCLLFSDHKFSRLRFYVLGFRVFQVFRSQVSGSQIFQAMKISSCRFFGLRFPGLGFHFLKYRFSGLRFTHLSFQVLGFQALGFQVIVKPKKDDLIKTGNVESSKGSFLVYLFFPFPPFPFLNNHFHMVVCLYVCERSI